MKEDLLFEIAMLISQDVYGQSKEYERFTDLSWDIVEKVRMYDAHRIQELLVPDVKILKTKKTTSIVEDRAPAAPIIPEEA